MAPEAVGESLDPRDPLLRLSTFFDDGSVELLHERDRSGVLAAAGTVNGVRTIAFCTDGTVMGGAMGVEGCRHIVNAYDTAIEEQSPIVGIWLAEGVKALHAVGLVFEAMIRRRATSRRSRWSSASPPAAPPTARLTDVIVMAPESRVFVTGPDVVRSVTGEDVDMASLGGPDTHHKSPACATSSPTMSSTPTSVVVAWSDCSASRAISTAARPRPVTPTCTRCCRIRRPRLRRAPAVTALLDDDAPFEEFQGKWAPSIVVGLGRLSGRTVGCWPTTRCGSAAA